MLVVKAAVQLTEVKMHSGNYVHDVSIVHMISGDAQSHKQTNKQTNKQTDVENMGTPRTTGC